MGKPEIKPSFTSCAAALLLAALLLVGACSEETGGGKGEDRPRSSSSGDVTRLTTVSQPETTADEAPDITLGEDPGGRPEAALRLEGGPRTTFSGLCSVGSQENVLRGKVPKRFTFDLNGSGLSCRIEKTDQSRGALRVVLIAGDTTRSVQQTNSPDSVMNVSYGGS